MTNFQELKRDSRVLALADFAASIFKEAPEDRAHALCITQYVQHYVYSIQFDLVHGTYIGGEIFQVAHNYAYSHGYARLTRQQKAQLDAAYTLMFG